MNEHESEEESERVETELVFLYIHGFAESNPRRAGAGVVALNKNGVFMFSRRTWLGERTENQAAYQSLAIGLDLLLRWWDVKSLIVKSDSGLLVRQMRGESNIRNNELQRLKDEVDRLIEQVGDFQIELIPREENEEAIRLSVEGVSVIGAEYGYEEPDPSSFRVN